MTYLKAYMDAVVPMASVLSLIFLFIAYFQGQFWPIAVAHICLVGGIAGPIRVWIDKRENVK